MLRFPSLPFTHFLERATQIFSVDCRTTPHCPHSQTRSERNVGLPLVDSCGGLPRILRTEDPCLKPDAVLGHAHDELWF